MARRSHVDKRTSKRYRPVQNVSSSDGNETAESFWERHGRTKKEELVKGVSAQPLAQELDMLKREQQLVLTPRE